MALIVGLQAGENQVELLLGHGRGQAAAAAERVGRAERRVLDVDRAIRAARERLANHLLHARGPGRADHDLAAVLLAEPQALFERVGVGLVHLVRDVLLADPRLVVVQTRLPLARGHLFDTDGNLHKLHGQAYRAQRHREQFGCP